MRKVVLLLAVVVGLGKAYDFSDETYNAILERDLLGIGLDQPIPHGKFRRSAKPCPPWSHPKFTSCCNSDIVDHYHDDDEGIRSQCREELKDDAPTDCSDRGASIQHTLCIADCVAKKLGYMDDTGKIDNEKLKQIIKPKLSGIPWLQPKLDDYLDKCTSLVTSRHTRDTAEVKPPCKGGGVTFGHCIYKEIQFGCPDSEIEDKEKCENLRNAFNRPHGKVPIPKSH